MTLPKWMRTALFATAFMNLVGGIAFLPSVPILRELAGLPEPNHPLYTAMVSMFVLIFGLAYFWTAVVGTADRLFLAIGAAGKLTFFAMVVWYWATGSLAVQAPILAAGDLVFGLLFLKCLLVG